MPPPMTSTLLVLRGPLILFSLSSSFYLGISIWLIAGSWTTNCTPQPHNFLPLTNTTLSTTNIIMQSQTSASGPELRGSNITLSSITSASDVSNRKTKIVCTLGPACWDIPTLEGLIDAGMNVARFNFSHGDHEGHKACLDRLRQAAKNKKAHVGKYNIKNDIWYALNCIYCNDVS